eukprot:gene34583-42659_t
MVAQAQRSRAPMQRMADQVAGYFVVAVVGIAVLTLLAWGFFGPEPSWVYGLVNAVAVLIIACPCALGLATPMSIMVATGRGATSGVLFRDAAAIENLRKVDALIIDKTGTLTEGRPVFDRLIPTPGIDEAELLRLAASLDQGSEHPLAEAIVKAARERGLSLAKPEGFESGTGIGVRGIVEGRQLALGNTALMQQVGVDVGLLLPQAETLRAEGASVMYLAADGHLLGLLAVSDPVKASTPEALAALRAAGLRIGMATGDGLTTARAVGARLGIAEVHGEVKPADKLALVSRLQAEGRIVAMAGDGINDAPALAKADIGIAMGGMGTDTAMEAADIVIMNDDLRRIPEVIRLSRRTLRLSATYQVPALPALKVGATASWQDGTRRDEADAIVIRQGGYAVLGLMAQYELNNQLSLRLNVANVADKKYLTSLYWSQGYYAAPRNASATLTWKY